MATENIIFELPGKLESHLATLNKKYEKEGIIALRNIIVNGGINIKKGVMYDNWDGGTYGHEISFTLDENLFFEVLDEKSTYQKKLCEDINAIDNTRNEFIDSVNIILRPGNESRWREQSGLLKTKGLSAVPDTTLQRIWGDKLLRVFLSHKAEFKSGTADLQKSLARCGIAGFVAHKDVEPTQEMAE